VNTGLAVL
jgi:hypothetical protein